MAKERSEEMTKILEEAAKKSAAIEILLDEISPPGVFGPTPPIVDGPRFLRVDAGSRINYHEDRLIEEGGTVPHRGSPGAAAWDIHSAEDVELAPYVYHRIKTGLYCEIPQGHVLLVLPRSGFSFKNQIVMPNSVGVIDEDYRGEISITACWTPNPAETLQFEISQSKPYEFRGDAHYPMSARVFFDEKLRFHIKKGDRIAQALLVEYKVQEWRGVDGLSTTARGAGGFGSTGVRS